MIIKLPNKIYSIKAENDFKIFTIIIFKINYKLMYI